MRVRPLEDVDTMVDWLGGGSRLAERLGVAPATVSGWRSRGRVPVDWWPALLMIADERGLGLTAHRLMEIQVGVPVPHGRHHSALVVSGAETPALPRGRP